MAKFIEKLLWRFRGIKVFALVGKSGTGKSFRAKLVSQKYNIDVLIDDGLLIRDHKILAGKSAKKENAYLAAVKTAIFTEPGHKKAVVDALQSNQFKRILILGTSDKMVHKIAGTLDLPPITKIIRIEDIATQEEIETALHHRTKHGKHVIPVPTIEVKRNYPRIMSDSIKVFLKKRFPLFSKDQVIEKTVVQPEFSKGKITVSESALSQMVFHCMAEFAQHIDLEKLTIKERSDGYRIDIQIAAPASDSLAHDLNTLQDKIIENIQQFTGVIIQNCNITIARFKME